MNFTSDFVSITVSDNESMAPGNTTEAVPGNPYEAVIWTDYKAYNMALAMLPIYTILLFIPGTIGNFLAMAVILQKNMRNLSSSIFIIGMAIFDNMTLLGFLLSMLYQSFEKSIVSNTYCRLVTFFSACGSMTSTWIVVAMSMERMLIVSFPLKAPHWTSRTRVMICVMIIFVANFLHNIQYFWTAIEYYGGICYYDFEHYHDFLITWSLYDTIMHAYIPLSLVFIINSIIISQMNRAKQIQKKMANGKDNPNGSNQITVMLLSVSIVFFICMAPQTLLQVLQNYYYDPTDFTPDLRTKLSLAYQFTQMMWMLNHCINVVLYSLTGRKFRNEMLRMLTCGRYTGGRSAKYSSDVTRSTGVSRSINGSSTTDAVSSVSGAVK